VSAKPAEVRMGKGKGNIKYWVCPVKKGQVLYEIDGVSKVVALKVLKSAGNKLPLNVSIVTY